MYDERQDLLYLVLFVLEGSQINALPEGVVVFLNLLESHSSPET
jgi:hypothetical protein